MKYGLSARICLQVSAMTAKTPPISNDFATATKVLGRVGLVMGTGAGAVAGYTVPHQALHGKGSMAMDAGAVLAGAIAGAIIGRKVFRSIINKVPGEK